MLVFAELSLPLIIGVFLFASLVIAVFGYRMAMVADILADVTGIGEALMGALFLGGSTSLPGLITSITAAAEGHAELAVSNAMGGIAAQTVFLAIADIGYRKANLEHAAASGANLMQGALLVTLLAIPILVMGGPQATVFSIHPASFIMIAAYVFGLNLVSKARTEPMWAPRRTPETRLDRVRTRQIKRSELMLLWTKFILLGIVIGFAGFVIAKSGISIIAKAGISETIVGGIFTAIATSIPELVTSVAAVRQGALTLAVGGIIGGNCFDVLFVAFSDVAYREGSIYGALTPNQLFLISLSILLTGILLLGLLRREKHGIGNIGFESFLIIAVYLTAFTFLLS